MALTEDDSGRRLDIAVGQEAVVRLASNPSTGYKWAPADTRSAVMAVVGEPSFEPPARPLPGAPGTEVWRLKAMTEGQGEVRFEYRRPWERAQAPARAVSFTFLAR
jgi:inhibitor of cysteine peptidase